jgi:hypothetical protein
MSGKGFGQPQPKRSTVTNEPFSNLPPGTTQKDYMDYLMKNWDTIATFAYDGYLTHGKGVVIADWDKSLTALFPWLKDRVEKVVSPSSDKTFSQLTFPLIYTPRNSEFSQTAAGAMFDGPAWERLIDHYDPQTSVILAVGWAAAENRKPGWMVRTWATPESPPKDVFERSRGRMSEFS